MRLKSSERSNSVFWSLRSVCRVRADTPNSLIIMTFSSPGQGESRAARPKPYAGRKASGHEPSGRPPTRYGLDERDIETKIWGVHAANPLRSQAARSCPCRSRMPARQRTSYRPMPASGQGNPLRFGKERAPVPVRTRPLWRSNPSRFVEETTSERFQRLIAPGIRWSMNRVALFHRSLPQQRRGC